MKRQGTETLPIGFEIQKPPLGVMPKKIWMELRAKDLARAINKYIEEGRFSQAYPWVKELNELLDDLGEQPIEFPM